METERIALSQRERDRLRVLNFWSGPMRIICGTENLSAYGKIKRRARSLKSTLEKARGFYTCR